MYVSDSGNARLQVFTRQGRFVRQFGSFGNGKGQFLHPYDVAADNAGNVYVADDQGENVSKVSPGGKVIWQIGGASGDPDLIGHHHFSAFDTHGRLVMVNDDVQKVLYVDAAGHKVDAFYPKPRPSPEGTYARPPLMRWGTRTCRAAVRVTPGPRWYTTGRTG